MNITYTLTTNDEHNRDVLNALAELWAQGKLNYEVVNPFD